MSKQINKVSFPNLVIALGIIYGDIGTSPLYVLNAIIHGRIIEEKLILGALSCIIWTLTLQTTVKYVWLTLKADNNGEGGIFSLYALVRRQKRWLVLPAMIGGAALLADGMITPPISVTASIEGLRQLETFRYIEQTTIVCIVLGILVILFFLQQFGTESIGKLFGPIMTIWFGMLAVLGCSHLLDDLGIFKALSPYYAIELLTTYPKGFWILGAVFLCTTGAEALYSDLGHCGKSNIRISWIYVKTCLILNYLGQGAWLMANYHGRVFDTNLSNPFYNTMPGWFVVPGIIIATAAAIIASQALITGSFTLISESMRLNLWPKLRINYPTEERGQSYIPAINFMLFIGCCGITLYFRTTSNMDAAYGLAITLCMLATSILFANYLVSRRTSSPFIYLYLAVYLSIELSFLAANLDKFKHGGYVTLIVGGALFAVMYVWFRARKIKNRYVEFVRMEHYIPQIQELSNDRSIPKFATHLVYMTSANNPKEIEHKIIYSILNKKPKRSDIYWFVHVDTLDDPYTAEYSVDHIIPNDIIRVEFRLGFRIEPKINLMFRKVVEDLVNNKEVNITSRYESLERNNVVGDFQFIVMEKYLSQDNELPFFERVVMKLYFWLKEISLSEERGFGLDPSNVTIEKFPLVVSPVPNFNLKRIETE
ncbi:KUP/HAK/KT family potassium transporter [Flavitalea sp. BT771]|uniref:KUP/HAK/KT family potassium transporter n=1 Tax=Flavitalea sp. BT771 TaxID=3063329 RepID=UPI0026E3E369|nr:KUP/HAK/KT family potassium transporter [Flavitalea sp. BT771]MDO6428953.1 KUP/HAK/KT family potassium transporter [Flavitalea sp. BT771]MDV6218919.1 KUP/HAK/KT family potassium transporter [Flavitalea sp. BT771]